ncbi:hypothetical protein CDL62_17040 [Alkalitalea saponilacus]|nr:hypothetical protein CDL62_17040 [Alkalitalea saponilacus]
MKKSDSYIAFQTGLNVNAFNRNGNGNINSLGFRNSLEYKTKESDRFMRGYFLEHSTYIGFFPTLNNSYENSLNWYFVGADAYYKIATLFKFLSWEIGAGVGVIHLYSESARVGLGVNLGSNLNIRFSERFSMDIAPLLLFPPVNRYCLSTIKIENAGVLHSFSLMPIGFRVKL